MNKYIFSDEEINKILMSSPMVLPNNPRDHGLRGDNIKAYFYEFIRRLMLLINQHFSLIEEDKSQSIEDIRSIISDLMDKDTELGDRISNHYSEINLSHDEIKAKIESDMLAHENDKNAHEHILFLIAEIKQTAKNALDFAEGKSKIIPVKDIFEMTTKLSPSLNVGDKFVLSDKNVPDFTLFEKESTNSEATSFSQMDILMGTVDFVPGESYICNGYLLVASESGIDTSNFARQDALATLEILVNKLEATTNALEKELKAQLTLKETAIKSVSETAETVVLQNKTEHNLGLRTSVILQLPSEAPGDFECIVNFRSGTVATTFDSPSDIIFTQDDSYGGKLIPISNRVYEINIKTVEGILIAKVSSTDLEVIE